jgi:hypothetical protein
MVIEVIAALAVTIWLYLAFGRGGFWLSSEREEGGPTQLPAWPSVIAVIPALQRGPSASRAHRVAAGPGLSGNSRQ